VVLVVGHSNTVPEIVRALGGGDVGEIPDGRYDDFFIVVLSEGGSARTIRGTYGERSP
jgi:hypothetical protein